MVGLGTLGCNLLQAVHGFEIHRNGIQFRYNSFPIKQLRRLAHFVLFWQDGGIHSHYP
jgi:hypothetical protein